MFGGGGGGGGSGGAAVEAVVAEPVKEKEAFDLKLTVVDAKAKIKIIKEIRTITGLGLKEVCHCVECVLQELCTQLVGYVCQAKELVERAPVVVKEGIKKEEAEAFKKVLIEAGAQVEVL